MDPWTVPGLSGMLAGSLLLTAATGLTGGFAAAAALRSASGPRIFYAAESLGGAIGGAAATAFLFLIPEAGPLKASGPCI